MSALAARQFFISYAREDEVWAREKARTLQAAGIDVFVDVGSLRAGDEWPGRLLEELEQADQVWLGWSRFAAQSEWVRREYTEALRLARERGAERFLLIDRLDDTPLPQELQHLQAERSALGSPQADRLLQDPHRALPPGSLQPTLLLRSEYQVVPFHGRTQILNEIERWCSTAEPFGLRLYVGPGGSGKTRLLAEVCARLRGRGWDTGFLDRLRMREALHAAPERIDRLLQPRLPRLVVIDYAETRRDEITAILSRAVTKHDGQAVRLALLARTAGEWWSELLRESADFGPLLQSGAEPIRVRPLAPEAGEREEAYAEALQAFAGVLGTAVPQDIANLPDTSHVLFLHLAALLAVLGERDPRPPDLMMRLLEHEERYWRGVARDVGLDKAFDRALGPAIALVTLVGGVARGEELQALLGRVPLLADRTYLDREQVADVLRPLYGWEGGIEALRPDRVGEALVARELGKDRALVRYWHSEADALQIRQGMTVLGRIAAERPEAQEWLREVLATDTRERAILALEVAVEGSESVARVLTEVLESQADPELAGELEQQLPPQTVVLRELAVVVTSQAISGVEDEQERGRLLSNLGGRLREIGRREEALAATEEAVQIHRRLAEARPDVFLPFLAGSLNSLGICLAELGHREEALAATEEATEIRRRLAEAQPDALLPDLAVSLTNLGARLREIGRREEALAATEEAAASYRRLAEAQPDAFLPELTISLTNLSVMLSDLGRKEESLAAAEEAADSYRRLVEAQPDAFLPGLAASLNNLGNRLREAGRTEEALTVTEEAVQIRRRLAEARPDVFLPFLAGSLNNLGVALRELGHSEEALAATKEAAESYRRLAEAWPDVFLPDLAVSLTNLSTVLGDLGRAEEALAATEEVAKIQRRLEAHEPWIDD